MDIRNTRQLKEFSAERLANARDGQKIVLYYALITVAVSAAATALSYVLSQQIARTGGLGSMGVRSALTTAQTLLPIVQAVFFMCLTLGYLATMLRIARGQYASPNGMRLGFDRFWVLLRCTLLKGLIFGGVAMASMYVAIAIYMMTPLSNSVVDILMPLVKNAGTSGILLDDATYAQLMDATMPAMGIFGVLFLVFAAPVFYRYRMADYLIIDRPATGALAALRDSRMMTKGNRWNLFRLDLSMWWYYAAVLVSTAIGYGDQLLPALGITLSFSDTVSYFLFLGAYLAATFAVYYFLRNRVEVTYALAYDSIRPQDPENNGAVLGNIFQM